MRGSMARTEQIQPLSAVCCGTNYWNSQKTSCEPRLALRIRVRLPGRLRRVRRVASGHELRARLRSEPEVCLAQAQARAARSV